MAQKSPSYVVTDLEESDEEELLKNLLTVALNQSPKLSRGTSTIREWMAIVEHSPDLKHLLALTHPQRQTLETYASSNPDMELDIDHIMCMYSMIRKSKNLDLATATLSATGSPIIKAATLTKPKKQHSHILQQQQQQQAPSSPTPSELQPSIRVGSSASQRIIGSSSRFLDNDSDDIPFRPQSKGKKVSIGPALVRHTASITDNNNDEDTSRHDSNDDNSNSTSKQGDGQLFWKTSSMNVDDIKVDDNTKNKMASLFDDTQDGYSGNSGYRSPNVTHERLLSHRQNSKLSFQPLDGNWKSQNLNNSGTTTLQQEHEQRVDQNAMILDELIKEMETEMQTLRQKIKNHETLEAQHKDQIEELTKYIENLKSQAGTTQGWRDKLSDEINKLQDKLKQNLVELDNTRNSLLSNKHKCVELQKESAYWKSIVEKREDDYDKLQKDLDHQKSQNEKLELEIDMKNDQLEKSQVRIDELEKVIPQNMTPEMIQETLAMVDRLQKEKEAFDTIINSTANELASMTKGYDGLQKKVKELERQRDQQLKDMPHTTGPSTLWYQRESINQDKKRLSSVCKQLDSQANVIDQLRLQILSNGTRFDQDEMDKKSPRWLVVVLSILGSFMLIMMSVTIYALYSPRFNYGLMNDPNGDQRQWIANAPAPRSSLFLILDRLFYAKNHTYTPSM